MSLALKLRTVHALGWLSIARVLSYRVGVRFGLNPVRRLSARLATGPFFRFPLSPVQSLPARKAGYEWLEAFGQKVELDMGRPPDWFKSSHTGNALPGAGRPWWSIPDFDDQVGDIKGIWELSRFDWVLATAQHAARGEADALIRLNAWLEDWAAQNPPYLGPNWKCGQEASIRVMHLLAANMILDQRAQPEEGLVQLVRSHLQRIAPTIRYAMGQDNNHGTSEAAALFMGGSWLESLGLKEGRSWQLMGRKWLEDRAFKLVQADGSFSQYSLNYHRLMLDSLCLAEIWRRRLELPEFSARFRQKASAAARWLYLMVDPATGDGPNVGANDGARLLPLTDTSYRDYRPSVQLATVVFRGIRAYPKEGSWDLGLRWLGLALPDQVDEKTGSFQADDGGFMILRQGAAMAMLRYPRFRFRPSQADALHVDLWVNGQNVLRDAGTYSYNTTVEWMNYFGGVAGHNTVQFDGRDQMPRLSRFLFGRWLRTERLYPLEDDGVQVRGGASYRDAHNACHCRRATLSDSAMQVQDDVEGFVRSAVLRWRLLPGVWRFSASPSKSEQAFELTGPNGLKMRLKSSVPIVRCELTQGWESRYYLQKTPVPVVELEMSTPGSISSNMTWPA